MLIISLRLHRGIFKLLLNPCNAVPGLGELRCQREWLDQLIAGPSLLDFEPRDLTDRLRYERFEAVNPVFQPDDELGGIGVGKLTAA